MWRKRRRRSIDLGRYEPPESFPEPSDEELVDEGLLIAAAGVRLAAKNLMVLRVLREQADYDEAWYTDAVRQELQHVADEKERDLAQLEATREKAEGRPGKAEHHADYRSRDVHLLEKRERILVRLVERLRELADDDEYAAGLVAAARESALAEVGVSIRRHAAAGLPDPDYDLERSTRLRLLAVDLAELGRQNGLRL